MVPRKTPKAPTPIRQRDRKLVLMGDVRQAPFEVREGGRAFRPVIALWMRPDDGFVFGHFIDEPGHPAQILMRALRAPMPVPGQAQPSTMPSQVVLFSEDLAKQVKSLLAPLKVEVMISAPFKPFDDMFADLFAHLRQANQGWLLPDLPDDVLRPLISAAERLWRAKPWEFVCDYPPFALVPKGDARPLFASILGARKEVFGVALYTSLEDYDATVMLGESPMWPPRDAGSPAELDSAATQVLEAMRHRVFLVSFEPKDEMAPAFREHLAQCGWSRRLSAVPTFAAMGGGQKPGALNAQDALEVALALDALVAFCLRHRKQLSGEEFPLRDTVEVSRTGQTVRLDVSIPGDDPSGRR